MLQTSFIVISYVPAFPWKSCFVIPFADYAGILQLTEAMLRQPKIFLVSCHGM